ncbi:hypothetical protein DOY81_014280, partial [Sarcophaga bullata]
PEAPPHGMEAIQFNRTSVFLKWQPPYPNRTRNEHCCGNLTTGVTYYIAVAAATKVGLVHLVNRLYYAWIHVHNH